MSSPTIAGSAAARRLPLPLTLAALVPLALLTWAWMVTNAVTAMIVLSVGLLVWVLTIPLHEDIRATWRRAYHLAGRSWHLPSHPARTGLAAPRLTLEQDDVDAEFARIITAEQLG